VQYAISGDRPVDASHASSRRTKNRPRTRDENVGTRAVNRAGSCRCNVVNHMRDFVQARNDARLVGRHRQFTNSPTAPSWLPSFRQQSWNAVAALRGKIARRVDSSSRKRFRSRGAIQQIVVLKPPHLSARFAFRAAFLQHRTTDKACSLAFGWVTSPHARSKRPAHFFSVALKGVQACGNLRMKPTVSVRQHV